MQLQQRGGGIDQNLVAASQQLDAVFKQLQQKGASLASKSQMSMEDPGTVQYVMDLEAFSGELSALIARIESGGGVPPAVPLPPQGSGSFGARPPAVPPMMGRHSQEVPAVAPTRALHTASSPPPGERAVCTDAMIATAVRTFHSVVKAFPKGENATKLLPEQVLDFQKRVLSLE